MRIATVLVLGASLVFAGHTSIAAAKCTGSQSCLCSQVNGRILLRGTTQLVQDGGLTLTVDELIKVQTNEWVDVKVGEQVGGDWTGKTVCGEIALSLVPGAEVLAFYRRGTLDQYPDCLEYKACSESMCGPAPDNESNHTKLEEWDACDGMCVESTQDACRVHRPEALLAGNVLAVPWAPTLIFGEQNGQRLELDANQLGMLENQDRCLETFPAPPDPPCDDVVYNSLCLGCGIATSSAPISSTLLLLLIFGCWRTNITSRCSRFTSAPNRSS